MEHIERYFDLDVCKCFFDGVNLVALHPSSIRDMSCVVRYNIFAFDMSARMAGEGKRMYERAIRNGDRGHADPCKYIGRMEKYRQRGFKVSVAPDYRLLGSIPRDGST